MLAQENKTGLIFNQTEYDFDTISDSGPYIYDFVFKNSGDIPVLISSVFSSCGCIVVEYPRNPILKGESGMVKVKYNATSDGYFTKLVIVKTDEENNNKIVLRIKGVVKKE